MAKLRISDVNKKHIRILGYLSASVTLAYILTLCTNNQNLIFLAPVINYVLYAVAEELKKEGYIQALKK